MWSPRRRRWRAARWSSTETHDLRMVSMAHAALIGGVLSGRSHRHTSCSLTPGGTGMKSLAAGLLLVCCAIAQTDPIIDVTPGSEVIKNKDLYEKTGLIHPFR